MLKTRIIVMKIEKLCDVNKTLITFVLLPLFLQHIFGQLHFAINGDLKVNDYGLPLYASDIRVPVYLIAVDLVL